MTDEELNELLGLVDESTEDVPITFERRLWDELSTTFDPAPVGDADPAEAHQATTPTFGFAPVEEASTVSARWMHWGSLVAAATAVVVVAIGVLHARTPANTPGPAATPSPAVTELPAPAPSTTAPAAPPSDATAPSNETTPVVLLDPVEACERFKIGASPLINLPETLEALTSSTSVDMIRAAVDDIESIQLALITYATDLEAGDFIDEAQVREFTNAARSLRQALTEIDRGNFEAASRTVGSVRGATNLVLQSLEIPGLQYDPFDPTSGCVD